ncbi:MAG: VCBS repeat-containing protein, partial [Microthrixaceae bacterium]|nr:VCBS repeat-containing protein [Microthrixaceae bacterium]
MAEGQSRELSRAAKVGIGLIIVATLGGSYALMGGRGDTTAAPGGTTAGSASAPATDPPSSATEADTKGVTFSDQSEAAGFTTPHSLQDLFGVQAQTSGAAAADVFGTGRSDLYVTRVGAANSLYRNNGDGTFTDVAGDVGLEGPEPAKGSSAAAFADVNADGCPDLFVSGAQRGRSALYVNDCTGGFADETEARGLGLYSGQVYSAVLRQDHGVTFADYDNNGTLDLLVLQWDPSFDDERSDGEGEPCLPADNRQPSEDENRSRLWSNDGAGNFTDVTERMGLRLDALAGFTGQFSDVDGDTWPDLLIAGDFCTSRLYRNDEGTGFTDVTNASGVGGEENGMGSVVSDVNGDGAPDWFVTSIGHPNPDEDCAGLTWNGCSGNHLYLNDGSGGFSNAADELGVQQGWWGWGAAIEDFSGDGQREIVQANGFIDPETRQQKYFTPEQIAVYEQFTE